VIDHLAGIWGYCPSCERWRHSAAWAEAGDPACPVCGNAPSLIERRSGDHTVLDLQLEVAVGPVGNRHFL
jgi:hypothetical protein